MLLLDQMEAHVHPNFIDASDNYGTNVVQVPAGFKSVSQPCDVGIMKPLKTELVELCQYWKVAEYNRLGGTRKIPVPGRIQVLQCLNSIWKKFPSRIIQNSFRKCGFTDELDVDINVALELV